MKNITITLTEAEAAQLFHTALNGYGDGDYYGLNHPRKYRVKGSGMKCAAFGRAIEKLQIGLQVKRS